MFFHQEHLGRLLPFYHLVPCWQRSRSLDPFQVSSNGFIVWIKLIQSTKHWYLSYGHNPTLIAKM